MEWAWKQIYDELKEIAKGTKLSFTIEECYLKIEHEDGIIANAVVDMVYWDMMEDEVHFPALPN